MGARLRVFLSNEQDQTLLNLRSAGVTQKVKDRAEVIRLNGDRTTLKYNHRLYTETTPVTRNFWKSSETI
jgi:hypothetical protein